MKFIPNLDNLLVKVVNVGSDERTASGLYIPDVNKDNKPVLRGTVEAAGDGRIQGNNFIATKVTVGDDVWFQRYSATEIKLNDEQYFVIPESQILGYETQTNEDLPF